ncbi:hypothetical protein KJ059_08555 [Myxococcota bacterium]|nr:hypothetical protein [Myxococcota bacterium]
MTPRLAPILSCGLCLLVCAASLPVRAELWIWVDDEGRTHVTDDERKVPAVVRPRDAGEAELDALWGGRVRGPEPAPTVRHSSRPEDRAAALVRGALEDLARGEQGRAAAALDGALRSDPHNVEAHWYLALLDRQRGRLDSSRRHLEAFLARAGDSHDAWRASAQRRLAAIADEKRLAAAQAAEGPLRLAAAESPNFRIQYDEQLGATQPDYARHVARWLEEARAHARRRLGVVPAEKIGVVFYGKAAYLAAHRHRFSFPTVGFYDGRIHVASAAHPAGELRALLFHEYVHAVFAERTGGHRPFWLNEGLAELAERASSGQEPLARREQSALRESIAGGAWVPLAELAAGFGGLPETTARLAYLESTAAAGWVVARATPSEIAALLERLGAGEATDAALRGVLRVDTEAIDAAIRREIEAEFTPAAG